MAKGVGACGFTSNPRQQHLTEASTGVGHTSALTTQINLARMAPAQRVVFIEKQVGECVTPCSSEERNWRKGMHLVVCALVVMAYYGMEWYGMEYGMEGKNRYGMAQVWNGSISVWECIFLGMQFDQMFLIVPKFE